MSRLSGVGFLLILICIWADAYHVSEAFVPIAKSSNRLSAETGSRSGGISTATRLREGKVGEHWTTTSTARRRRTRGDAARCLRAGLSFSPLPGTEALEYLGRELAEQSVKHHWQSGFIGGSVGVVGTLTAIKLKINQVKELTACPYCRSSGQLPCAMCFGVGSVAIPDTIPSSNLVTTTTLTCPCCRGKTFVTCVNCKGDGRGVPLFLNKKVSRDPESEIEDVGYA